MDYRNITPAYFVRRPKRFVAQVLLNSREETVHVKNTGRCAELLVPGAVVYLEKSANPARKTRFDLVAVEKQAPHGPVLINMDSAAPNTAAGEWLRSGGLGHWAQQGWRCAALFVIQMKGVHTFAPNWGTHPDFGLALRSAQQSGVEILAMDCRVTPTSMVLDAPVPVDLSLPADLAGIP